jgi:hypothetical protein
MEAQLFGSPRPSGLGESGLLLGAVLMLSYFLLSAAMLQDYSRKAAPPVAGQMTILVLSR